jgi:transcriptional regulator with XRE-family HTH domain
VDGDADFGVGMNVRRARRYQGLSLEQLADRIGKSKGWLSMIENGRIPLERRSDIAALADALQVSVSDLIGKPFPVFAKGSPDVTGMREALMENSLASPAAPVTRPLDALASEEMTEAEAAWRGRDHGRELAILPGLLTQLHAHAAEGPDRTRALDMLTRASVQASGLLKELGQIDLAWIAADRARQAADAHGSATAYGMAAWALALARPAADKSRALMTAGDAAATMESGLAEGGVLAEQVYGMLRLTAALASHLDGDPDGSRDQLGEAVRVAGKIGEQPSRWEAFGPANAGVWQVTLAVEAGEPTKALECAARVNPADLISGGRRAALHLEKGRALAMLRRTHEAVMELREGERICPLRIRCDSLARDLVGAMLERSRREAGGRDLRGLAWRMGVIKSA